MTPLAVALQASVTSTRLLGTAVPAGGLGIETVVLVPVEVMAATPHAGWMVQFAEVIWRAPMTIVGLPMLSVSLPVGGGVGVGSTSGMPNGAPAYAGAWRTTPPGSRSQPGG
jgi:hypothetical protein